MVCLSPAARRLAYRPIGLYALILKPRAPVGPVTSIYAPLSTCFRRPSTCKTLLSPMRIGVKTKTSAWHEAGAEPPPPSL